MRTNLIIILIVLLAVTFGCKKKREVQIVGEWNLVPMTIQPETYTTKWSIKNDGSIEEFILEVPTDTATYTLIYKFPEYYVDIENLGSGNNDKSGRYRIDDLSDESLKITRTENADGSTTGAFLRYEFLRE